MVRRACSSRASAGPTTGARKPPRFHASRRHFRQPALLRPGHHRPRGRGEPGGNRSPSRRGRESASRSIGTSSKPAPSTSSGSRPDATASPCREILPALRARGNAGRRTAGVRGGSRHADSDRHRTASRRGSSRVSIPGAAGSFRPRWKIPTRRSFFPRAPSRAGIASTRRRSFGPFRRSATDGTPTSCETCGSTSSIGSLPTGSSRRRPARSAASRTMSGTASTATSTT